MSAFVKLRFAALLCFCAVALPRAASAHTMGLSTGEYTAKGASVVVKLAFARSEIATLAPAVDANRDGHVTSAEVAASRALLEAATLGRILVSSKGVSCTAVLTDAGLLEEDGLLVSGRWDCRSSDAPFDVDVRWLETLAPGHRHIARAVTGDTTHDQVLDRSDHAFSISPEPADRSERRSEPESEQRAGVGAFFRMGLEHILTGYDHLLFLFGLVLVRARVRSVLAAITAFTLAHSVTLALAALNVWVPSPRIVEPLIALSIAWVGVENVFVREGSKRWRITFPFGLVHGFGFAGALREVALSRSAVPMALVSFNLGVEAGQIAVLAVLLPILARARKAGWLTEQGYLVASGAIAIVGAIWFVKRVVS
jgi:hydrogenase/urease accessory protein HupE